MPNTRDFITAGVQATIYLADPEAFAPSAFLSSILSAYDKRFNGQVHSLPIPADAPPEIPRVIMQSRSEQWKLEASPARVNAYFSRLVGGSERSASSATNDCAEMLQHFVRKSEVPICRLAFVTARGFETPNPAQTLVDRFCNDRARSGPFSRTQTFEIHNHKVYALPVVGGLRVNSWVRCKTGFVANDVARTAVVIEQDLNTLVEEAGERRFTPEDIGKFFRCAFNETQSILELYFAE